MKMKLNLIMLGIVCSAIVGCGGGGGGGGGETPQTQDPPITDPGNGETPGDEVYEGEDGENVDGDPRDSAIQDQDLSSTLNSEEGGTGRLQLSFSQKSEWAWIELDIPVKGYLSIGTTDSNVFDPVCVLSMENPGEDSVLIAETPNTGNEPEHCEMDNLLLDPGLYYFVVSPEDVLNEQYHDDSNLGAFSVYYDWQPLTLDEICEDGKCVERSILIPGVDNGSYTGTTTDGETYFKIEPGIEGWIEINVAAEAPLECSIMENDVVNTAEPFQESNNGCNIATASQSLTIDEQIVVRVSGSAGSIAINWQID